MKKLGTLCLAGSLVVLSATPQIAFARMGASGRARGAGTTRMAPNGRAAEAGSMHGGSSHYGSRYGAWHGGSSHMGADTAPGTTGAHMSGQAAGGHMGASQAGHMGATPGTGPADMPHTAGHHGPSTPTSDTP